MSRVTRPSFKGKYIGVYTVSNSMAVSWVLFLLSWSSVGLLCDAEMIAHTMVVIKHLLVSSHIEVTFKTVEIAELELSGTLDESTDLD